jgi:hypothetical protein
MKTPRIVKYLAFAVVALATLVALALAVENYRGKRAWQQCRTELEARGESFDWTRVAPQPAPDAENFAMTPLLAPFCNYRIDPKTGEAEMGDTNACEQVKARFVWAGRMGEAGQGWRLGETVDLAAWQKTLRESTNSTDPILRALGPRPSATPVEDLRFLLGQNRAEMDEIRAALRRPHTNFKTPYGNGLGTLLPHLSLFKGLAQPFRVSAFANLASGKPDAAVDDIAVLFALAQKTATEPLVVCGLCELPLAEFALQPVWEGLVRHQWRPADLERLEATLRPVNGVAEMRRCLRGERNFILAAFGNAAESGAASREFAAPEMRALRAYPSGWLAQNQVHIARSFQDLIGMLDAEQQQVRIDDNTLERLRNAAKQKSPYTVFSALLLPAIVGVVERTALHQASLSLARVAIALERHRLAHGRYPDSLAALAPAFLESIPPDPVTGKPLVYRPEPPDQYTLYSVGLNHKDDGGQVARDEKGRAATRKPAGDWAWPSQAAPHPAAKPPR